MVDFRKLTQELREKREKMAVDKFREQALKKQRQIDPDAEGGDDRFHQWAKGKNSVRFLPVPNAPPEAGQFYKEFKEHYFGGTPIRCLTKRFFGKKENYPDDATKCPLCKRFNKERRRLDAKYERGTDEAKEAFGKVAKRWAPRTNYYSYCFDPTVEDSALVVKPCRYGNQIMQGLLTEYLDGQVRFWLIRSGRTMIVKKTALSQNPRDIKYTVTRTDDKEDISDIWEKVEEQLEDLENFAAEKMAAEDIEALVKDVDEAAREVDEEDRERPRAKPKRETGSAGDDKPEKPKCFGDEDTYDKDDDVCIDCAWNKKCVAKIEAAKGDDDEPAPKKKLAVVKGQLAKKGGKVRDDEDDDDE